MIEKKKRRFKTQKQKYKDLQHGAVVCCNQLVASLSPIKGCSRFLEQICFTLIVPVGSRKGFECDLYNQNPCFTFILKWIRVNLNDKNKKGSPLACFEGPLFKRNLA